MQDVINSDTVEQANGFASQKKQTRPFVAHDIIREGAKRWTLVTHTFADSREVKIDEDSDMFQLILHQHPRVFQCANGESYPLFPRLDCIVTRVQPLQIVSCRFLKMDAEDERHWAVQRLFDDLDQRGHDLGIGRTPRQRIFRAAQETGRADWRYLAYAQLTCASPFDPERDSDYKEDCTMSEPEGKRTAADQPMNNADPQGDQPPSTPTIPAGPEWINPGPYQPSLPEAKWIVWGDVTFRDQRINVTAREGCTPAELTTGIEMWMESVKAAFDNYAKKHPKAAPAASNGNGTTNRKPPADDKPAQPKNPPAQQPPRGQPDNTEVGGTMRIVMIKRVFNEDGKPIYQLFKSEKNDYPEFTASNEVELHLLTNVLAECEIDISKIGKLPVEVDLMLTWRPTKKINPKTKKPYRNIATIVPRAA